MEEDCEIGGKRKEFTPKKQEQALYARKRSQKCRSRIQFPSSKDVAPIVSSDEEDAELGGNFQRIKLEIDENLQEAVNRLPFYKHIS